MRMWHGVRERLQVPYGKVWEAATQKIERADGREEA